jgi:phosphoribosyl 1,2-cyclic phosphodiesterase
MRLKFYGTRGSIPVCDVGFQQFGGNTTCLQITFTDTNRIVIIDAGTGLRNLGRDLRAIGHKQEQIVIAFTHFHWDHIQGFPFFAQAYDAGQKITLLTLGRDQTVSNLREIFEVQMQAEYFPVQLDHMGADFEFLQIADASKHFTGINNVETIVTAQRHNHPGGAYSFRIERNGKVLVVCTDVEHGEQIDPRLVELAQGADLLVHDAQYTAEELQKRRGWGHSSFDQAMQLAEMAGVKRLALTHHDPDHDDEFLERIEKLCRERFSNAVFARGEWKSRFDRQREVANVDFSRVATPQPSRIAALPRLRTTGWSVTMTAVPGSRVSYTFCANSGLMRRRAAIFSAGTLRPLLVTVIHRRAARPGASELCRSVVPSSSE